MSYVNKNGLKIWIEDAIDLKYDILFKKLHQNYCFLSASAPKISFRKGAAAYVGNAM